VTLGRFFTFTLAVVAAALAVLLAFSFAGSKRTLVDASDQLRVAAAERVTAQIASHLGEANQAIEDIDGAIATGLASPRDRDAIARLLRVEMARHEGLTELAFTWAPEVARAQLEYWRAAEPEAPIELHRVSWNGKAWIRELGHVTAGAVVKWMPEAGPPPMDPTDNKTYKTPTRPGWRGESVLSDLAYAQRDVPLPEPSRRRIVTVQRALTDRSGEVIGVVRAGVLSEYLDQLVQKPVAESDPNDPHRVFICDPQGRLITRLSPDDIVTSVDDDGKPDPNGEDLRVVPKKMPAAVAAALKLPTLSELDAGDSKGDSVDIGGEKHLVTFAALPLGLSRSWIVGIVVPESYYLRELLAQRRKLMMWSALALLAIAVGGYLALRALGRGLGHVTSQADHIRRFEFAAAPARSAFRDVTTTVESLERAKTALRAMGKYVPVELVRQLFAHNEEPAPGGALRDITLLFTDIEGFTSITETLPPQRLAEALGHYLEAMTRAIHAESGTVDKFIGDAVMALWNAPLECADHPVRACRAALACVRATRELYASPVWQGLAPWHTRFGLHRGEVTVGHFGAPDRLSYTALGDGVNLAARLEGLNKQYGTTILVSAAVEQAARAEFAFRRIDRVAVKGKHLAVDVFELLEAPVASAAPYEAALECYFAGRFADALVTLEPLCATDSPSRVLADRCRRLVTTPPPADWDGVFVAKEK
jgi:adenylate cyclase